MALTIAEQLDILEGSIVPSDGGDSLSKLVEQVSVGMARDWYASAVETAAHTKEWQYSEKMYSISDSVLNSSNNRIFNNLSRLLISIYSEVGDIATVTAATSVQWVNFIENNIEKTFEIYSLVRNYEKEAYVALP